MEAFYPLQLYLYIVCTSATVDLPVNLGILSAMVFTSILKQFQAVVLLLGCLQLCYQLYTLLCVLDLPRLCFPLQAHPVQVTCPFLAFFISMRSLIWWVLNEISVEHGVSFTVMIIAACNISQASTFHSLATENEHKRTQLYRHLWQSKMS